MIIHESGIFQSCKGTIRIPSIDLNMNSSFVENASITILVVMIPIKIKNCMSVFIDFGLRSQSISTFLKIDVRRVGVSG